MSEEKQEAIVNVEFRKSPSYSVVPATDIWRTRTTDGHILCNFLVESEKPPESLTLRISDTGQAVSEEERSFEGGKTGFIKEFMVGVMMTPQAARSIGISLIGMADAMQPNPNIYTSEVGDLNADDEDAEE